MTPQEQLAAYATGEAEQTWRQFPARQDLAPRAFAALRAVLALHHAQPTHSYYGDTRPSCKACHQSGNTPVWPCPTVAAISSSLEA